MRKLVISIIATISILNASGTLSPSTFKKLQKAQEHIEKSEYKQASDILNPIVNGNLNAISKSYALQALSNIAIANEKYEDVAKYYNQILKLKALEQDDLDKTKLSLAQIYLSLEKYKESLVLLKELLNSKAVEKRAVYGNFTIAYYYMQDFKNAVEYTKKAIELNEEKEQWYRILYSSYIELKDYKRAITTLEYMVKTYSQKEEYWLQLISLYQTTQQFKKALATMELAYENNAVDKKKNAMYFVGVLLNNGLYNKAGLLLEDAINKEYVKLNKENFDTLISSFLNAKNYEKSIKFLRSSQFANTEKYKVILGNIYYTNSDYKNCIEVLSNFQFKKNSIYDGQRSILVALSAYEINDKETTIKYLKNAVSNKHESKRAKSIANDLGYKI